MARSLSTESKPIVCGSRLAIACFTAAWLASIGAVFVPFYAQTNTGNIANRTDVFATLAASATASATTTGPGVGATGRETVVRAQSTQTISMTPEFQQKVHDSVIRTISRRLGRPPRTP